MKPVSIIVGALAAFTTAAPAMEARSQLDLSQLNNLNFNNVNLAYFNVVNSLNLGLLQQLGSVNNLNLLQFQSVFNSNAFDVQNLLAVQQLQTVLQLAELGAFNQFDLSSLAFNQFNFGLVNNLGGFDLNSLIDASLAPQLVNVVQTAGVVVAKE